MSTYRRPDPQRMRQLAVAHRPVVVVPAADVLERRDGSEGVAQQLRRRASLMKANEVATALQVGEDEVPRLGIPYVRLTETEFRWDGADVGDWLEGRKCRGAPMLAFEAESPAAVLDREGFARLVQVPTRTVHHLLAPDAGTAWSLPRVVDWLRSRVGGADAD